MGTSIDLERVKNKLAAMKKFSEGGAGVSRLWKPAKDKPNVVRILNYPHGQDPFVELWFHYNIGEGQSILCPKLNSSRSCPICDFANELKQSGSKEDAEMAKTLWPKQRIYAVVVDRADPTMTPKFWGFGKTVYNNLLSKLLSEDYGSYMDPVSGLDLEVKVENVAGKQFPDTKLEFRRRESKLADDKKTKEVLANIIPIDQVFKPATLGDIKERLNKWISAGEEEVTSESAPSSNDREVYRGKSKSNDLLGESNVEDLDGAFAEALGSDLE
jgi:hypothetical protein